MKKYIAFLLALQIGAFSYGQNFEGEIIYQNSYKSNIPGLPDEKFTSLMGSTQDYFVSGAKYKSVLNGSLLQWQLYIPGDNKIYSKMSNNEAAMWIDAGTNPDSVMSIELNKSVLVILGYNCDEVILNCRSGIQKFYYSSKLSLDPKLYVNHKYGNWYDFVSKSKAVPLKIEIINSQFTMTSTAVEVKPMKLEDGIFQLPPGITTGKSSF